MTELENGYLGRQTSPLIVDGQLFNLTVHLGKVSGEIVCIGVDVRAFQSEEANRLAYADAQPVDGGAAALVFSQLSGEETPDPTWSEVDTAVYRAVRLAESVARAKEMLRATLIRHRSGGGPVAYWVNEPPPPEASEEEKALVRKDTKQRLSQADLAHVVAPAWREGIPGKIEAVRAALEHHWGERVTVDQAKKAISQARRTDPPLIPQAKRRGANR